MKNVRACFLFILAITLSLFAGCHTLPPKTIEGGGISLKDLCEEYHVQWQLDNVTQVVNLQYKGNKARAMVGSKTVLIGQQKLELSGPIRRENNIIYVPEDFEGKVLAPFGVVVEGIPRTDLSVSKVRSVVIDAGHGGKDPGTKGVTRLLEKEVNLDVAKRVRDLLIESGLKVIMTRDKDVFVSLPERTEIATKSNADLFVSIHANWSATRKTRGVEVYYVRTQNKKDLQEEQRTKNEKSFAKQLNAQYTPVVQKVVSDMMYQRKVENSRTFALEMAGDICRQTSALNRGARPCRFAVVRNTLMPAILIELGYLSNRDEEKKLNTASYRQQLAEAIAHRILNYANQ